jgi:DUF4097 and DUF4098 domain-containing protein YvlB
MEDAMTLRQLIAVAILGFALPLAAEAQGRSQIDTTVSLEGPGTVDLSLIGGSIRVTGWDRRDVRVVAVAEGDGRLRFDAESDRVTLGVDSETGRHRHHGGEARYEVSVPRGTHLILEAVSGNIAASGSGGEIDATSLSGQIEVSGGKRKVSVESVSGWVRASHVSGNLRAESVSGDVRVDSVAGNVDASSVSGTISLLRIQSRAVRSETVSGNILYVGNIETGGYYDFESHSGTLRLDIPRGSSARVSVETFSGDVDTNFPVVTPAGEKLKERGRFGFTIGDGRASISAATFSGPIIIRSRDSASPTRRNND